MTIYGYSVQPEFSNCRFRENNGIYQYLLEKNRTVVGRIFSTVYVKGIPTYFSGSIETLVWHLLHRRLASNLKATLILASLRTRAAQAVQWLYLVMLGLLYAKEHNLHSTVM